jgi:hypothetical protein
MLAMRRSNAMAVPFCGLAARWPSLCALCGGRGRVCAACRAAFVAAVPRCALGVATGLDVCGESPTTAPAVDAALAASTSGAVARVPRQAGATRVEVGVSARTPRPSAH